MSTISNSTGSSFQTIWWVASSCAIMLWRIIRKLTKWFTTALIVDIVVGVAIYAGVMISRHGFDVVADFVVNYITNILAYVVAHTTTWYLNAVEDVRQWFAGDGCDLAHYVAYHSLEAAKRYISPFDTVSDYFPDMTAKVEWLGQQCLPRSSFAA